MGMKIERNGAVMTSIKTDKLLSYITKTNSKKNRKIYKELSRRNVEIPTT
jgi:hypothetical protein